MATGKYSRVDGRRSSGYCSTIITVALVAVCLVGVWALMTSSVSSVQNSDVPSEETTHEVKHTVEESDSKSFKDNSDSLPDDATKEDSPEEKVASGTTDEENSAEQKPDEISLRGDSDEKTESQEEQKNLSENDGNEKTEDGESSSGDGERNSETGEGESGGGNEKEQTELEEKPGENKSELDEDEKNTEVGESSDGIKQDDEKASETEENPESSEQNNRETNSESEGSDKASGELFPAGAQAELLKESNTDSGSWSTQAVESQNEKKSQESLISNNQNGSGWKLCNTTAGPDYIPCLDNWQTIKKLHSTKHYEHRERHCPDEAPSCLVPLPEGYKQSIKWPKSREKVDNIFGD